MFFKDNLDFSIGKWNISLVPQAKLALISYAVLLLSMTISVFISRSKSLVSAGLIALVMVVYAAAIMSLGLYNLNCTVVGNCQVWAWVLTGFVTIAAVFNMWAVGITYFGKRLMRK
jgi:hypothetical protein